MTLDDTNVVVAGTGHLYVAPVGTAFPTGIADPSGSWVEVGYTAEDGLAFSIARQKQEVGAWQSLDPLRVIVQSRTLGFTATLREFKPENLEIAFGGGTTTKASTTGTYEFPDVGENTEHAVLLDFFDGAYQFRIAYPRMEQDGDVSVGIVRTGAVDLPLTFRNLASTTAPKLTSNHPSFLSA